MIRLLLLGLGLALLAVAGAGAAAYAWFGPTGALAVALAALVALPLAAKVLGGKLITRLFKLPFQAKGAPLRDAAVRVHAVRRAAAPARGEEEAATDPREWYVLELTVAPRPTDGKGFRGWAPGELLLVGPDAAPEDVDDAHEWGFVHKARAWEDPDGWRDVEAESLVGEHRLRLLVGVRPGAPRLLRLRYYFELFGAINLGRAQVVTERAGV